MSNDGSTNNIPESQKADTESNPPDTASGGAPEEPDRNDPDGTPKENPSG